MTSYAAIKMTKDTMVSVLASVDEAPNARERLLWALLTHPYDGLDVYFIGYNFRRLNYPDYGQQILTQTELDQLFTYKPLTKRGGRPDPALNWFLVKPRQTPKESAA